MRTETIQLATPDGPMSAYQASPDGEQARAGVIIGMEIFGMTSYVRRVTERLAQLGFVALAPDFFHRTAPGIQLGRDMVGRERGLELTRLLSRKQVLADIQSAITALHKLGCLSVGMVGMSLGGHLAYLAATRLKLEAVSVVYGGWLSTTEFAFSQPEATLELTPRIGPGTFVQFIVGENDHLIPPIQQRAIQQALRQSAVRHEMIIVPGASHGFLYDESQDYSPMTADGVWKSIESMLQRELSSP